MTRKKSEAQFQDVKFVLELAVKKPGLIYELPTHGKAVNFRQRCYQYRNFLRAIQEEQAGDIPGFRAELTYDTLVVSIIDAEGKPNKKSGTRLLFTHRVLSEGKLIDPDTGEEVDLSSPNPARDFLDTL